MQPTISDPARRRQLRILCAEDDSNVRILLSLVLESAGHFAETASDGLEALAKVNSGSAGFDLIITDHHMPEFDGLNFVRQLRSDHYQGRIIVLSSAASSENRRAYMELGVDRMLTKPVKNELLLQAIEEVA